MGAVIRFPIVRCEIALGSDDERMQNYYTDRLEGVHGVVVVLGLHWCC